MEYNESVDNDEENLVRNQYRTLKNVDLGDPNFHLGITFTNRVEFKQSCP